MEYGKIESSARAALYRGSFLLWVTFGLSFFVNVLQLAGPLFIILIYDRVLTSQSEETLFALLFMVAVLIVALNVLDYARKRIVARFAAQFQERLEHTILDAAKQNAMFPEGKSKPAVGLDEADTLRGFFHSGGLLAVMDFIWAPMFVAVVFILHPMLGYVCLGGLAVMLSLVFIRLGFVGSREDRLKDCSNRIGALKKVTTASREAMRGQSMSTGFKSRWMEARAEGRDAAITLHDWTAWFEQLSATTLLMVRYGVLAIGAYLVLEGKLTVGAMVACAFLVSRVLIPVNRFAGSLPAIFKSLDDWKRLKSILASWDSAAAEHFPTEAPNRRVRLALRRVSVKSPVDGSMALQRLNLELAPGTIAEIVGATGQGKTAMAQAILGIARLTAGSITIDGTNAARLTDEEMAQIIGYVPENPRFIAGTIAENIARLDPEMTPEKVAEAASKVCLHGWISALPDGYQTMLDPDAATLSQGQRQQLTLARALYHDPTILIIDEPDGMLFERLPDTMKRTIDSHLKRGGVVLLLARNPIQIAQDRLQFRIEAGTLTAPKKIAANNTRKPAAGGKVTVLGDKTTLKGGA